MLKLNKELFELPTVYKKVKVNFHGLVLDIDENIKWVALAEGAINGFTCDKPPCYDSYECEWMWNEHDIGYSDYLGYYHGPTPNCEKSLIKVEDHLI